MTNVNMLSYLQLVKGVPEWWLMLQECCWHLRFAEVVGSNFRNNIPCNFWRDMVFTCVYISRTANTISEHFHVTCRLPVNPTMQLDM